MAQKRSTKSLRNSKIVLDMKQKISQFLYKVEQIVADYSSKTPVQEAYTIRRDRDCGILIEKMKNLGYGEDPVLNYWKWEFIGCVLTSLSKLILKIESESRVLKFDAEVEDIDESELDELVLTQKNVADLRSNILSVIKIVKSYLQ